MAISGIEEEGPKDAERIEFGVDAPIAGDEEDVTTTRFDSEGRPVDEFGDVIEEKKGPIGQTILTDEQREQRIGQQETVTSEEKTSIDERQEAVFRRQIEANLFTTRAEKENIISNEVHDLGVDYDSNLGTRFENINMDTITDTQMDAAVEGLDIRRFMLQGGTPLNADLNIENIEDKMDNLFRGIKLTKKDGETFDSLKDLDDIFTEYKNAASLLRSTSDTRGQILKVKRQYIKFTKLLHDIGEHIAIRKAEFEIMDQKQTQVQSFVSEQEAPEFTSGAISSSIGIGGIPASSGSSFGGPLFPSASAALPSSKFDTSEEKGGPSVPSGGVSGAPVPIVPRIDLRTSKARAIQQIKQTFTPAQIKNVKGLRAELVRIEEALENNGIAPDEAVHLLAKITGQVKDESSGFQVTQVQGGEQSLETTQFVLSFIDKVTLDNLDDTMNKIRIGVKDIDASTANSKLAGKGNIFKSGKFGQKLDVAVANDDLTAVKKVLKEGYESLIGDLQLAQPILGSAVDTKAIDALLDLKLSDADLKRFSVLADASAKLHNRSSLLQGTKKSTKKITAIDKKILAIESQYGIDYANLSSLFTDSNIKVPSSRGAILRMKKALTGSRITKFERTKGTRATQEQQDFAHDQIDRATHKIGEEMPKASVTKKGQTKKLTYGDRIEYKAVKGNLLDLKSLASKGKLFEIHKSGRLKKIRADEVKLGKKYIEFKTVGGSFAHNKAKNHILHSSQMHHSIRILHPKKFPPIPRGGHKGGGFWHGLQKFGKKAVHVGAKVANNPFTGLALRGLGAAVPELAVPLQVLKSGLPVLDKVLRKDSLGLAFEIPKQAFSLFASGAFGGGFTSKGNDSHTGKGSSQTFGVGTEHDPNLGRGRTGGSFSDAVKGMHDIYSKVQTDSKVQEGLKVIGRHAGNLRDATDRLQHGPTSKAVMIALRAARSGDINQLRKDVRNHKAVGGNFMGGGLISGINSAVSGLTAAGNAIGSLGDKITSAQASAAAFPGKLDRFGQQLGIGVPKDINEKSLLGKLFDGAKNIFSEGFDPDKFGPGGSAVNSNPNDLLPEGFLDDLQGESTIDKLVGAAQSLFENIDVQGMFDGIDLQESAFQALGSIGGFGGGFGDSARTKLLPGEVRADHPDTRSDPSNPFDPNPGGRHGRPTLHSEFEKLNDSQKKSFHDKVAEFEPVGGLLQRPFDPTQGESKSNVRTGKPGKPGEARARQESNQQAFAVKKALFDQRVASGQIDFSKATGGSIGVGGALRTGGLLQRPFDPTQGESKSNVRPGGDTRPFNPILNKEKKSNPFSGMSPGQKANLLSQVKQKFPKGGGIGTGGSFIDTLGIQGDPSLVKFSSDGRFKIQDEFGQVIRGGGIPTGGGIGTGGSFVDDIGLVDTGGGRRPGNPFLNTPEMVAAREERAARDAAKKAEAQRQVSEQTFKHFKNMSPEEKASITKVTGKMKPHFQQLVNFAVNNPQHIKPIAREALEHNKGGGFGSRLFGATALAATGAGAGALAFREYLVQNPKAAASLLGTGVKAAASTLFAGGFGGSDRKTGHDEFAQQRLDGVVPQSFTELVKAAKLKREGGGIPTGGSLKSILKGAGKVVNNEVFQQASLIAPQIGIVGNVARLANDVVNKPFGGGFAGGGDLGSPKLFGANEHKRFNTMNARELAFESHKHPPKRKLALQNMARDRVEDQIGGALRTGGGFGQQGMLLGRLDHGIDNQFEFGRRQQAKDHLMSRGGPFDEHAHRTTHMENLTDDQFLGGFINPHPARFNRNSQTTIRPRENLMPGAQTFRDFRTAPGLFGGTPLLAIGTLDPFSTSHF